jgi:hypothetical protein
MLSRCVCGLAAAVSVEKRLHAEAAGVMGDRLPQSTAGASPTLTPAALRSLEASLLQFLFGDADDDL